MKLKIAMKRVKRMKRRKKMYQRGRNALIRYFSFLLTTTPSNWKENNQCRFAFVDLHSCWRR